MDTSPGIEGGHLLGKFGYSLYPQVNNNIRIKYFFSFSLPNILLRKFCKEIGFISNLLSSLVSFRDATPITREKVGKVGKTIL